MTKIQSWFFSNDDKKEHVRALDGLRGIAVLMVLLSHTSNNFIYFQPSLAFNGIGKGGVYLFFVLSAYLLDRQISMALMSGTADSFFWKRYFMRRFLRIFPILIIALMIYWGLTQLHIPTVINNGRDVIMHLFLLDGQGVFWSVPVEFKYYILSPFILILCHAWLKWNLKHILIFFLCLSTFALAADFYFHFNKINTIKFLPVFLAGTYLAIYDVKIKSTPFIEKWSSIIGITGCVALFNCLLVNPNYVGNWLGVDNSNNGRKILILYVLLCVIMLFAALRQKGIFRRFLEMKFLRFTGIISFSVYLFHMPVIYFMNVGLINIPAGLQIYFFFGVTFLLSTITFLLIERPVSRIRISREKFTPKTVR
ncbi:MAG: acyltransferase [Saprospiraceae bacterium]|uniref:Acyltransferase n=1 Tax=Candidatus Opimibacter skivensis TaxID=2982028 RepID=A0A9D7SSY5_9BACT|nr:acyltransferase [Candidatus Opimibacter skivensis]